MNENQRLRAQNQEGIPIYRSVTVYLFLAENTMSLLKTAKQSYTGGFSASLRYILNENQPLRAQQNQEWDTDIPHTVTVHLFLA